jgi:hypothetical protein
VLLAVLTGLLLGLGVKYPRVDQYRRDAARTADMLTITRLKLRLTSAVAEAQHGAWDDVARELGAFYTGAERALADEVGGPRRVTGTPPVRATLRRALERREATLALVGARDARAVPVLREQLDALRRAAPDGRPAQ